MPPAHQKSHNHAKLLHHHSKALTVTAIQHQGAHDITSIFEIRTAQSTSHSDSAGDLLSLLPSACTVSPTCPTTTTDQTPTTPQSTAWVRSPSSYPRASPPIFLYPHPIVPPRVYEHSMQHAAAHKPTDLDLWFWLGIIGFIVVTLAGCWTWVVAAIHHRGLTTGITRRVHQAQSVQQAEREQEDQKAEQKVRKERRRGGWWMWLHTLDPLAAAREGKYEAVYNEEFELADRTTGLSSAHDVSARLQGPSPKNPFLIPHHGPLRAIRPRSSAEWAEQHRMFFTPTGGEISSSPLTHAEGSKTHFLSGAELACVESEAHEAQDGRALFGEVETEVLAREQRSWVDLGLATVDGAVDRFAADIVRWTDDAGRDEDLVLPLAKTVVRVTT